jgi:hypothetical protein
MEEGKAEEVSDGKMNHGETGLEESHVPSSTYEDSHSKFRDWNFAPFNIYRMVRTRNRAVPSHFLIAHSDMWFAPIGL